MSLPFLGTIDIRELLIRIPLVLIALSFHEWGHAYAAYRLGDPTARNMGRMTLDPFKHIDPTGLVCMILFRFGWAKPVPVNPRNFSHLRRDDTIVSLAGIAVNFMLAFVTMGLMYIAAMLLNIGNDTFYDVMYMFFFLNLALMVFNLLPIPPLDGYHVLKNALPRVRTDIWWNYERYGFIILIVLMMTGGTSFILGRAVTAIISGLNMFYGSIFGIL